MSEVRLDSGAIRDIDKTLTRLATMEGEITLRFDNHWPDLGENSALLAAALIGSLRDRPLLVDVVDEDAAAGLMRTAVPSALWRRPRDRTRFTDLASQLNRPGLGALWTSGSRSTNEALFAHDDSADLGAFGPRHATFVNPHLSTAIDGYPDIVFLVRRWLSRRLSGDGPSARVESVVESLGAALYELMANVQEHAAGDVDIQPDCLVGVSLTTNGCVRCSVMDTGVGIDTTLEPKIATKLDAGRRLLGVVKGDIPGWDAGRGIGLSKVCREVASHKGRLAILTDTLRLTASPGVGPVVRVADFSVQGTIIDLAIPGPSSSPTQS